MKDRLVAICLIWMLFGCADRVHGEDPEPVALRSETVEASDNTMQLGVRHWRIDRFGDAGKLTALDVRSSILAVFELTEGSRKSAPGGLTVISTYPAQHVQERNGSGEIVHSDMPETLTAMFDAYIADMQALAASEVPTKRATFAYKEDICMWCGAGGTQSKCYGVVLMCWDLDLCSGTTPDDEGLTPACNGPYVCGACIGLPF